MTIQETILKVRSGVCKIEFYSDGNLVNSGSGFIHESKLITNSHVFHPKGYTFAKDTRDGDAIFSSFERIISDVYSDLVQGGFKFKTITVVCRFSGFETRTKSKTLNHSDSTPMIDFETLKSESNKLLLRFIVENPKPIRLIGLRVKVE